MSPHQYARCHTPTTRAATAASSTAPASTATQSASCNAPAGGRRRGAGRGAPAAAAPAAAPARAPWLAGTGCREEQWSVRGQRAGWVSQLRGTRCRLDYATCPAAAAAAASAHLPLSSSLPRRRVLRSSSRYLDRAALLNLTPETGPSAPASEGSIVEAARGHCQGHTSSMRGAQYARDRSAPPKQAEASGRRKTRGASLSRAICRPRHYRCVI